MTKTTRLTLTIPDSLSKLSSAQRISDEIRKLMKSGHLAEIMISLNKKDITLDEAIELVAQLNSIRVELYTIYES